MEHLQAVPPSCWPCLPPLSSVLAKPELLSGNGPGIPSSQDHSIKTQRPGAGLLEALTAETNMHRLAQTTLTDRLSLGLRDGSAGKGRCGETKLDGVLLGDTFYFEGL